MMCSNQDTENPCPCGSGEAYLDCCGPCHTHHKTPETAEALMRSRYVAYVLQDWDYLHQSWHPSTRPPLAVLRQGPHPDWTGLEIVQTGMAKDPDEAFVEFRARYRDGTHAGVLHETSRFVREQGYWQYVDGELDPVTQSPGIKVGRNQACPCGSGRKFKHCCGRG